MNGMKKLKNDLDDDRDDFQNGTITSICSNG